MSSIRAIAYNLGKQAAFEKIAIGQIMGALAKNPWIARTLAGAGIGAGTGALTAGEGRRGEGALMGGALGALGGAIRGSGGKLQERAIAKPTGLKLSPEGLKNYKTKIKAFKDPTGVAQLPYHAVSGTGMGLLGGLDGGLATRALVDKPEPTWTDKLKGMVGMG